MNSNIQFKNGFSLVELMIALVIMGILTSFVYPSYVELVVRGYRAEAMLHLTQLANRQQQYFADHRRYASNFTQLGYDSEIYLTEHGYYQLTIRPLTNIERDFVLTAQAVGAQSRDLNCSEFRLDSYGVKTAFADGMDNSQSCWEL